MILPETITKRVSLDTKASLINEQQNLEAVIKDEVSGTETISPSTFTEIIKEGIPTGIYFADLVFTESGQFLVTIRHKTLGKSGANSVTINSGPSYSDLEESVSGLKTSIRSGVSFA